MGNKTSLPETNSKAKQVPQIYSTKPENLQEFFAKSGVKKLEKKEEPKQVQVDNEIIEIGGNSIIILVLIINCPLFYRTN